jgi:hypothetical protein
MTYRKPVTVSAKELTDLRAKGSSVVLYKGMELEGEIGEIILASNDQSQFGSFDFHLSGESKRKFKHEKIPSNFSPMEIDGIKEKPKQPKK